MQVKRQREDFIVREITPFVYAACGAAGNGATDGRPLEHVAGGLRFAVYRLDKSGLGTPEAASEILSTWNLRRRQLNYGGLKDRHAVTSQMLTIYQGPAANLEKDGFTLTYLGQAEREYTAKDIEANEFDITLRELTPQVAAGLQRAFDGEERSDIIHSSQGGGAASDQKESARSPLLIPNYFDEQRFGSLGESGQFIAQPWCLANYEQALFLAIAEANRHDRPDDRQQKEILRDHWGDWQSCKDRLERSHRRSIVTYLVDHPTGFKKAVALIRQDMRSLYVAAFQAKLWNEIVSRRLSRLLPKDQQLVLPAIGGQWVFPRKLESELSDDLSGCQVPLPSGRQTQWPPHFRELLEEVLAEFGIERHKLRFSHPRDVFFSRGLRDLWLVPQIVSSEMGADEFGSLGTCKLRLVFRLHPGQYATMLIKGLELHANHIHATQEL